MAIPIVESHRCFPQLERNQYGVSPRGDSPIAAPLEICIVASLARSVGQVFSVWLDRISQREVWTLTVRPDEEPRFNDLQRGRDDLTLCSYCDQVRSSELSPSSQHWRGSQLAPPERQVETALSQSVGAHHESRVYWRVRLHLRCERRLSSPEVHHFCRSLS